MMPKDICLKVYTYNFVHDGFIWTAWNEMVIGHHFLKSYPNGRTNNDSIDSN